MQNFDIVRPANHCAKVLSISLALAFFAAFASPLLAQTFTVLTTFSGGLGPEPAALVQGFDGNFYGTSDLGGVNNKGAIYRLTPDGVVTVIYSFCAQRRCTDGSDPGGLILGEDGNFYGSTSAGGTWADRPRGKPRR